MQLLGAEAVWARVDPWVREEPGGVIATDGDGTLWSGDVGDDLFHAFLDHGRVEPPALEAFRSHARDHALSDAGTGSEVARRIYDAYLGDRFPEERMYEIMTWCFAGWKEGEVREFARRVVSSHGLAERFHPEVLRVIRYAREAGVVVILVSASPVAVIAEAGALAGFGESDVVAARPVYRGGVMTPEVERPIPYASGKVLRLRERIAGKIPLYAALGDNAFDVAMLACARVAVAVRPKERLRRRASEVPGIIELTPTADATG